ncbi:MAG TPA: phytase [Kofleriaceae bacterium]|nr:phytase [Kofleriaceae bacterium]
MTPTLVASALAIAATACSGGGPTAVAAARETAPVASGDDAADDACIWIDREAPERSTIIGTDKRERGGLNVYDLAGELLHFVQIGELINVDLRDGFPLGGEEVAIVVAGNETSNQLEVLRVDRETRGLVDVAAHPLLPGVVVYGSCLYRSAATGDTYVFVNSKTGRLVQLRLFDDGAGRVAVEAVRDFEVGSQVEGCVADDELGDLYVGEEEVGIWRYPAEPDGGDERVQIAAAGDGTLVADVEGLAIYPGRDGDGYLIASSQGDSTFSVYGRRDGAHVFRFAVVGEGAVDGVSETDGIDVARGSLGDAFPDGLFVAQDDDNDGANQNFKLVSWGEIAAAADPPLFVER